jgi:hypothetical protein
MFVDIVTSSTQTEPYVLQSWLCNKGVGPVKTLPDLSEAEIEIIRSKSSTAIDAEDLPTTWTEMCDLYQEQTWSNKDLTESEVRCAEIFKELPVLYHLLEDHERRASFVDKLDQIWRAIEMTAAADDANRLLELDLRNHVDSQGVSTVSPKDRNYQQYQMFDTWARLMLPCLPPEHLQQTLAGIKVLTYLTNMWQWKNRDDTFYIDLYPFAAVIHRTVAGTEGVEALRKALCEKDANINEWIDEGELEHLAIEAETRGDGFLTAYAKVVRRGLRQFLGKTNVSTKVLYQRKEKNEAVRVTVKGLKRLIFLACVRRIKQECSVVTQFGQEKFFVISKFRESSLLANLIPSEDELVRICGLDL